jgi:hypothetical protein
MTARQPTYVIVILDRIKADCTGVSGNGKKLGRCCSPDGLISVTDVFQPTVFTTVLIMYVFHLVIVILCYLATVRAISRNGTAIGLFV